MNVKVLLLDNYDSFTYNLYHLIGMCSGYEADVVKNDQVDFKTLLDEKYDYVVISPGPGSPENASDLGASKQIIEKFDGPLLGVCLGHQAIVHLNGGDIVRGNTPMHGRISAVEHDAAGIFKGIPSPFDVVRYHSLIASTPLPSNLKPIAKTADDVVMAVAHVDKQQWGIQFHPESICSQFGAEILSNFFSQNAPRSSMVGQIKLEGAAIE